MIKTIIVIDSNKNKFDTDSYFKMNQQSSNNLIIL